MISKSGYRFRTKACPREGGDYAQKRRVPMSYLSVQNLVKTFGDFKALDDVSISIDRGEVCALLGPSGCGKTTTLRCIAGLENADFGVISLDGHVLSSPASGQFVLPERREL